MQTKALARECQRVRQRKMLRQAGAGTAANMRCRIGYTAVSAAQGIRDVHGANKILIKQKTFKALCIAQEKTEQYSGQNEVIYVEDITVVKIFMTALQEELDFGMDMYNRWCSGKTKVKVLGDGHISFWANDNRSEYIIKLMISAY